VDADPVTLPSGTAGGTDPAAAGPAGPTPVAASRDQPRRRFRRRWLAVVVGLVLIVAIAVLELPQFLTSAPTATIWENITAGITDGTVPTQTALEAFAYLYQVDIPGVTVPQGIEGGDEPSDGSGALSWVQADWSSLTPEQQAVIDRYLVPGPDDQVIPIYGSPAVGSPGASAGAFGGAKSAQPLGDVARPTGASATQVSGAPPAALVSAMNKELDADIKHIGPKLGIPVISGGSVAFPNIELILSETSAGTVLFQTTAVEDALHYEPCHMTAFKNAWQGETVTSGGGVSPRLHVLMTHEVVHCYQNVVWGSVATHLAIPPWITEGTALYLAADDTGIEESMIPSMWTKGYFVPETALTNRTYDAFGYYALLAHEGRDLWSLMKPAWQAAAASSTRSDAFIGVLTGDAPDIRDNWAESYLRKTSWGDPWIAYGFGLPASAQVVEHLAQAQPAPGWTGSLASRSNTVLNVDSSSGEVVTVSTDGLASVHDDAGHSDIAFTQGRFCVVATCVCPTGTKLAGQDMASDPMTIPFVAAFNAPRGGSKYSIVSQTLAELCGQPTPAPSSRGPCGSACSSSNGDPHLRTVNQYIYDFQAAGEFTLLRSADGSVDIQARQEPYASVILTGWAINTAVAARVGSHRIGVYQTGDSLQAHVDGQIVDLSGGPMDLGGGASISTFKNGFVVDFPDGTTMWTMSDGYGIFVQIKPSATLAASGSGLLGPIVPGGMGVPALPDGSRLPVATSAAQRDDILYGQFADAWRVTDATTLFDYDAGKSTASYTIKPYPVASNIVTLPDLSPPQTAAGDSACAAIADSTLHDDCVFDVGVTGQTGFAGTYQAVQSFYDSGIVGAPESIAPVSFPPVSAAPGGPTVISGATTVTKGTAIGGYAVDPNDTVYLSVQTAKSSYSLISFDPKAGKIVNQVAVPALTEVHYAAGSLWLPGLKDTLLGSCSVTRFDASTLTEQATIPVPCAGVTQPIVASDGSALWFEDTTTYHPATKKGAYAVRLDPTTGKPGTRVPMPEAGGYLIDSQGAIFYTNPDTTAYYVLPGGASAFVSLGKFARTAIASGAGLWTQSGVGKPAMLYTQAGTAARTVTVAGTLVAADSAALYAEVDHATLGGGTELQLWRYPIDGTTPTELALPPKVNGSPELYSVGPPPTTTADGFVKVWAIQSDSPQASIELQWTPLN
jgi:hypothetical protein